VYHSENFQKYGVCVRFDFVSCLSSEEESWHTVHSRNVNNQYCIVITPVEQSLQPVEYGWWQKQHLCSHCVSFTFAWGYYRLLLKNFCILCSVLNRWWGFTAKL